MTQVIDDIKRILASPNQTVSREWMEQALDRFPYLTLPLLLYLQRNPSVADREDLLARLAIASPDRRALALQLGEDMDRFAHFYPEAPQPVTPDTDTTIDRFLGSYGTTSQKEIEALEQAIFNPMPDYADVLAAEEQQGGSSMDHPQTDQEQLINQFLEQAMQQEQQPGPAQQHVNEEEKQEIAHTTVEQPSATDDSMLSESLAKMYISMGKYSQALEIIENISLNFPEKSIYFADQIRFLRKLVLNQNILNHQKQ